MRFRPTEILFAPTLKCNLRCAHCGSVDSGDLLGARRCIMFLQQAKKIGVRRVGFTGGEPFLAPGFLFKVVEAALREGLTFGRIMTNAVWYKDRSHLSDILRRLFEAGFDGDICISFDDLHRQSIDKVAHFIMVAVSLSGRADIVSVVKVAGARDTKTRDKIARLATALGCRFSEPAKGAGLIKGKCCVIKVLTIDLVPVGRARRLSSPWAWAWFKDDYCGGPGNVLYVNPDGNVMPCCGYSTAAKKLCIGNIKRDTVKKMIKNAENNKFIDTVFGKGLGYIRKRLERQGVVFPGKTTNHCFFCDYIATRIPEDALKEAIA